MQQGTNNFETFRRKEGEKMEKEEKEEEKEGTGTLDRQELLERMAELEREIQLSHQRQEILSRANQRLTKVIVNNNHQQQHHQLDFITRIQHQQKNSQTNNEMTRTFIEASPHLQLPQKRPPNKHTRVHTDHNEENNFQLSNTNGFSSLTRKEVKHRLSKQSALS